MTDPRLRKVGFPLPIGLAALVLLATSVHAQDSDDSATSRSSVVPTTEAGATVDSDVLALIETVNALRSEVRALNSQMTQLQTDQHHTQQVVRALEEQLARVELRPVAPRATQEGYNQAPPLQESLFATPLNSIAASPATQAQGLEERVANLEEDQQVLNSELEEQSQSKVESGSKYRVRFSGLVLFNLYENRGFVDNQDFPQIAVGNVQPTAANAFGGSLRQSQIGVEAFGPQIAGARTSADIHFDFAGGFPDEPNGAVMGLARLRTATIRFDWRDTSLVAGQDRLFFVPLAPTSLATVAIPALSYAGNLWSWTPQVRVEHTTRLSDKSSFLLEGGLLDSLTGDEIYTDQNARYPSWGEQSGQPAYAVRVALTHPLFGQQVTLGTGGYYGRQSWGFGRHVDGWTSTEDLSVPLGNRFALTGAFYRGRAVGGLWGGMGQDVLLSGSLFSPTTIVQGLDSLGGWMQLKFKPWQKFEINGAYGQDNPFAGELDRFPSGQSYYGTSLTRNQSPLANFIYTPRSDVELSFEYRRLKTMVLDEDTHRANLFGTSVGYRF